LSYLKDQATPPQKKIGNTVFAVRQLNGASASFPVANLKAIGGWNGDLRWMEDTDVCTRLARQFPKQHFYAQPIALITHDPKMKISTFVRRPFVRGAANLTYYRQQRLTPPVFPFPILWLITVILCLCLQPLMTPLVALLVPQILYFWWPLRAISQRAATQPFHIFS
jgi:hypothetical protein